MSVLRARMKPGVRPIVLNGSFMVPEYPDYWEVPAANAAGIELLVQDGQIEYEREHVRAPNGSFAAPGLQVVEREVDATAVKNNFARKPPRGPVKQ